MESTQARNEQIGIQKDGSPVPLVFIPAKYFTTLNQVD